jgi:hypothetical protein
VNTLESTSFNGSLKINRVSDFLKDQTCTKFGENPSKDVDSRVFTRRLFGKKFAPMTLTFALENYRVPDFLKD